MASKIKVPQALREIRDKAQEHGWTITHGGRHLKWTPPGGQSPVFTEASKISNPRSVSNTVSRLRARGLPV